MNERIKDAFDSVRAEDSLKRDTRAYLAEKTQSKKRARPAYIGRLAAACACLVLAGIGGWRLYAAPVSAISVDVNPSIELGVNRFDRVVSVEGYNDDGEAVAAAVQVKNMIYTDAIDTLLSSDAMSGYLTDDTLVSITVVGRTEQVGERMSDQIASCRYAAGANVECHSASREDIEAAHSAGLSFGKYSALLELQALDPSVTADDIRGLTMRQIRDMIEQLSGTQSGTQSGGGHGHGNGQGAGGRPQPMRKLT